jgi:glycosyltransferase involved in cell wall biosynthesis
MSPTDLTVDPPSVAVVIPTIGRSTLAAAVRSALTQAPAPAEVIVVVDGADDTAVRGALTGLPGVTVLSTGGGRGPSVARMLGARRATSSLVAFLDDDDEWLPGKLAAQIRLHRELRERFRHAVVSCRVQLVDADGRDKGVAPATPFRTGGDIAAFLFTRHRLHIDGFAFGSSTLLTGRETLELEPWNEQMTLHEDWEWILRIARRPDAVVAACADPLVRYLEQPPTSAAASRPSDGWRRSLDFAERTPLPLRARGDFLLCIPAVLALENGERGVAARIAWRALRTARPGWPAWTVFALHAAVPRRVIRRAADATRALGTRTLTTRRGLRSTGG